MRQCVVCYWYTDGAGTWPLQTSLDSLVRFGQMWSNAVISHSHTDPPAAPTQHPSTRDPVTMADCAN